LEPLPESARRGPASDLLKDVQSMAAAQLTLKGKVLGAVCLFSNGGGPFPSQQRELLSTICNQLTVALENARLYLETKKSAAQLTFVYNLGNNLMTSLEMDELLGYAVFTIGKSLECDVCAVVVRGSAESDDIVSAMYSRTQSEERSKSDCFHEDRI